MYSYKCTEGWFIEENDILFEFIEGNCYKFKPIGGNEYRYVDEYNDVLEIHQVFLDSYFKLEKTHWDYCF